MEKKPPKNPKLRQALGRILKAVDRLIEVADEAEAARDELFRLAEGREAAPCKK